jgi:hypothetical protein
MDEHLSGMPLVFDADGSGKQNVLILTSQGRILIYDLLGQILDGFPASFGGRISLTPVADDLDKDGSLELYALNERGEIFAWQLETSADPAAIWWPQFAFSAQRNTYIARELIPGVPATMNLMPAESVYNYPNPNQSDYTIIRYFLRKEATVSIKIFDLSGDLVASFNGPGEANMHNEKRWDLNGVSSGVYLCRVEAVSAAEKSVKIVKILVVN